MVSQNRVVVFFFLREASSPDWACQDLFPYVRHSKRVQAFRYFQTAVLQGKCHMTVSSGFAHVLRSAFPFGCLFG